MQLQLEQQQQQLAQLQQQNKDLKHVEDNIIPGLKMNGLLALNPETNKLQVASCWEEHQNIVTMNSKAKPQPNQDGQSAFAFLNQPNQ